ncbi:MAG TPA: autotransporter assembly complex family protein [Pseudomonadales bacterium]|nr:autotransporter assembly complex family protein [Pseudomonadales bacterium]
MMGWLLLQSTVVFAQANVKIEGVSAELEKNIRAHLGEVSDSTLGKPKTLRRMVSEAVVSASKGLGYYHATETHEVDGKNLTIKVEHGPRVHIVNSEVRIIGDGAGERWFLNLMKDTGLNVEDSLNHARYQSLKKKLRQTAQRHGYFDANFEQQKIQIDTEANTADVRLVFNTGPRYQFGDFIITGTALKPSVIRNLASFEAGDPFDATKVTKFNRNLLESRYFDDVRINVDPMKREGNRVPIEVKLRDVSDHKFGVGMGYGTDTGARLKFTWDRFLVNERGDSLSVAMQVAQIYQSITARYRIAGKKAITDYFEIQSGWQHKRVEDKDDTLTNLGFYIQHQAPSLWTRGLFVKLQNESFVQGDTNGSLTYIIPGISFSRTRTRGTIDPVWGDYLWTDLQYSDPGLGSDTAFVRWAGGFKYLRRLEEMHQLQFRAELGNLQSGDFDKVPASMRFFAGGDHSIRGYDYESISPRDDTGQATGGRFLQVGSVEYSYKILDQWRLATFVDTGRAFDHYSDPFYTGVGVGVRWLSPVGIVSIDLAHPDKGGSRDFKIHFYMGPPL